MKISLIQIDGKIPNLALMKIARFHSNQGDSITLGIDGDADKVYISVIFPHNRGRALAVSRFFDKNKVVIGGSGYDYRITLPDEIEHLMPLYELWNLDYSIGFITRGCIRKCPFCIVPKKEGDIQYNAPLDEFLAHDKLILLDNNLLAWDGANAILRDIRIRRLKVNFTQGLDIRLINETNAEILAGIRYTDRKFKNRMLYFAFDNPDLENSVRRGIEILLNAGIKPSELMFYILVGFNTTFDQDMKRFQILWDEYRVYPYVMIYNRDQNKRNPLLSDFARYVNKRIHRNYDFEDYVRNGDLHD